MTTGSLVLALIPARAGSKGVPGKNLKPLAGRPLIAYAVDAARASGVVDRTVVSTDSNEIAAIGRAAGADVPFVRPLALAADDTPMVPVIAHAVEFLEAAGWSADIVVLLQPTSPLRRGGDVAAAVDLLRQTGADSVVSVTELPRHFSPDYVMRIDEGRLLPFLPDADRVTRRQDARRAYVRDGTVYCFWRRTLAASGGIYGEVCVPLVLSGAESLTIDTPEDWAMAERRLMAVKR